MEKRYGASLGYRYKGRSVVHLPQEETESVQETKAEEVVRKSRRKSTTEPKTELSIGDNTKYGSQ